MTLTFMHARMNFNAWSNNSLKLKYQRWLVVGEQYKGIFWEVWNNHNHAKLKQIFSKKHIFSLNYYNRNYAIYAHNKCTCYSISVYNYDWNGKLRKTEGRQMKLITLQKGIVNVLQLFTFQRNGLNISEHVLVTQTK